MNDELRLYIWWSWLFLSFICYELSGNWKFLLIGLICFIAGFYFLLRPKKEEMS